MARDGYVNLLPVQQKNSIEPGDTKASLMARREFLEAGHYQPLRNAVVGILGSLGAETLLDIGCGEGYYTDAMAQRVPEVVGLDIAKPAIQLAARRYKSVRWIVGTGAQPPIADVSLDAVTCLFTQLHVDAMHRLLKSGGHVLVVTPAPQHLWSLRQHLFGDVHRHEPEKFVSSFASRFDLVVQEHVGCALNLTPASLRQLLVMTPYAWKARPENRTALEQHPSFETRAEFSILLFRKR